MGPLKISGTTSRLDCSRQLRRYVVQLGHTIGVVKPGGGTNTWKRPLLPSGQLSRPGRLVKALGHHTMKPNDTKHWVHYARQEANKKVYENIDPKSSEVYRLANQFRRENTDVVSDKPVKNDAGEMSMSEDKAEGLTRAQPKASQRCLTGTQTTCHINHQWKARPSQSPLIWLRRLPHRWRRAKHQAHQA